MSYTVVTFSVEGFWYLLAPQYPRPHRHPRLYISLQSQKEIKGELYQGYHQPPIIELS